jgi:hypothetical protein
MSDRARVHARITAGSQFNFFDTTTFEITDINSPLQFDDDFIGAGHTAGIPAAGSPTAGYPWVKKIVGAAPPTVALVSNAAGGQVACALTATSEKQDAALYWNDSLALDATKGLQWQCRSQLSVLPSAAGVQSVWGMSSAWIDGPDNASKYIEFGATASGAILLRSQDGTTQNSIASGVTVLATDFHVYAIDASDVTDIKFFIDGVQVSATGAIKFAATGASAILQTYASVYKPSGVGVATLTLDAVSAWNFR